MSQLIDEIRTRISDVNSIEDLNILRDIITNQKKYLGQKNAFNLMQQEIKNLV